MRSSRLLQCRRTEVRKGRTLCVSVVYSALGKLVYTESGVVEEAKQEIWAAAESCEAPIGLLADLFFCLGRGVTHPVLDVPVATLLWIQLWRVLRQPLQVEFGMLGKELLHHRRPMRLQPVPDQDHRPTDSAPEMLQEHNHVLAVDSVVEVFLVNPTRRRQPDRRGDLTPLAHGPQHRRLPLGSPRRARLDLVGEPRLIDEDDHRSTAASFFLIRGQSRSIQARINSSSRSLAWTAGTCGDQFSCRSLTER